MQASSRPATVYSIVSEKIRDVTNAELTELINGKDKTNYLVAGTADLPNTFLTNVQLIDQEVLNAMCKDIGKTLGRIFTVTARWNYIHRCWQISYSTSYNGAHEVIAQLSCSTLYRIGVHDLFSVYLPELVLEEN